MLTHRLQSVAFYGTLFTLFLVFQAGNTARPASVPLLETYRVRIENMQYGRVEMSIDGGGHYILIGRVDRPATEFAPDRTAQTAGRVLRSGEDGLAFSIAQGRVLKLRPRVSASVPGDHRHLLPMFVSANGATVYTNLSVHQGLFGDLLPPAQSLVTLQSGVRDLTPFVEGYTPSEDDVFVFQVTLPFPATHAGEPAWTSETWRAEIGTRIAALGREYAASAVARAQLEQHRIVSGVLNLSAKLPNGEPDPIAAVTYSIDGDMVAAQNTPPFTYAWDTAQSGEGEHLLEISALNSRGSRITYARTLVVVHNGSAVNAATQK